MPFSNQFALSLEITRLVPMRLVESKTYETVMSLARDLQNSGSDIVIEEDLADVFGRNRISSKFASSFTTVIKQSGTTIHPLCEGISLVGGVGPTVGRAFKHTPYFSTIVQLSLLTWVAPTVFVASAVTNALQKRLEGASEEDQIRAAPTQEGVSGVIIAIHEQTSSFDWSNLIRAVANVLPGIDVAASMRPPPAVVLQGLMSMFPIVQNLPADRVIYIRCCTGVCTVVVWAHLLLDLTVLVKSDHGQKAFGTGDEQVLIELIDRNMQAESSVSLLDSSQEELFRIVPDIWENQYPSIYLKWPTRGFAKSTFGELCSRKFPLSTENTRQAIIENMLSITASIAAIVCDHLVVDRLGTRTLNEDDLRLTVPTHRLLESARLLFDNPGLREPDLLAYKQDYSLQPLNEDLPPPACLVTVLRPLSESGRRKAWKDFRLAISQLSLYLVAFAHVHDLSACGEIPLEDHEVDIMHHGLLKQLRSWDGHKKLHVDESCWFDVFSYLLRERGRKDEDPHTKAQPPSPNALISGRGWSAYISTIGFDDPCSIWVGRITITKGVPNRNGVSRRGVMDGPTNNWIDYTQTWNAVESAGEWAKLRCADDIEFGRPRCGEWKQLFMFTLQVQGRLEKENRGHFGFRMMHRAIWRSAKSEACEHPMDLNKEVRLPPGCKTMNNICTGGYDASYPKLTICLTAHCSAARWRAVCESSALSLQPDDEAYGARIFLRGADCCFSCAIDQVATQPGKWIIIL